VETYSEDLLTPLNSTTIYRNAMWKLKWKPAVLSELLGETPLHGALQSNVLSTLDNPNTSLLKTIYSKMHAHECE